MRENNGSALVRSFGLAVVLLIGCAPSSDTTPAGTGGANGSGTGGSNNSGTGGQATMGTGGSPASGTGGSDIAPGTGGTTTAGTGGTVGTVGTGGQSIGSGGSPGSSGGNGGGRAGGQAGAAASGGAGGAAPQANCPAGALLCEDFESFAPMAAPNANKWTSRTNGSATVLIDTTHAHSGTKAVHFHATTVSNNQRAYILNQGAPVFPVTANKLYVRFMMYIGRYMSVAGTSIHNRIAWVGSAATLSSGGNGPGYAFVTYNGIAVERLTNPSQGFQRDTTQHMDDVARQNKWQCFEFEIDNMGGVPPGEQASSTTLPHIWQEGTELKLAAGGSSEPWVPAPFEALQFSLWCPQTDPMPTDYWIDDVVMSGQRINCPTAQ